MEHASSASLFDRLTDENPDTLYEESPKRFIGISDLQESILNDLSKLLNTKVALLWQNYICNTPVPFSYGVNATCIISAENIFEIQLLESRINNVIEQFEPRLSNVSSHVVSTGIDPGTVFINIDADLIYNNRRTPLSFPVVLNT